MNPERPPSFVLPTASNTSGPRGGIRAGSITVFESNHSSLPTLSSSLGSGVGSGLGSGVCSLSTIGASTSFGCHSPRFLAGDPPSASLRANVGVEFKGVRWN